MPGYATIGLVAPLLVLIGRLLQGFSAGVELGGVSVYLSEMATAGHKGFYVSWQSASQQVAIMASAALDYGINARTHRPDAREVFRSMAANWQLVVAGMLLVVMTTVSFYLITVYTPTFGRTVLKLTAADANGAMVVALTEVMPPHVRTAGFSLAYSLATALFGGFTPAISTWLIHVTGDKRAPGLWMSFAAACGLAATFIIYRGRRAPVALHS